MIIDGILLIFQGIISVLLAPLSIINIAIDFVSSIPVVTSFLQVVAFLLPWDNLTPLFALIIVTFTFRIALSLIKLIWNFVPLFGSGG